MAVMCLCEVAAYCKKNGITLWDQMLKIYEEYGYFKEGLHTITMKGVTGAQAIKDIMAALRKNPAKELAGLKVLKVRDYDADVVTDMATGEKSSTGLPKSNVLYFDLENDSWCCARPSGTEPKIKFYMGVKGTSLQDSEEKLEALKNAVLAMIPEV